MPASAPGAHREDKPVRHDPVELGRLILERAALELSRPGVWNPGGLAHDERGRRVVTTSRRAVQFSAHGMILRELARKRLHVTTEDRVYRRIAEALAAVIREREGGDDDDGDTIADYEDAAPTVDVVLDMLDAARYRL